MLVQVKDGYVPMNQLQLSGYRDSMQSLALVEYLTHGHHQGLQDFLREQVVFKFSSNHITCCSGLTSNNCLSMKT